jgi:hypothetical protein
LEYFVKQGTAKVKLALALALVCLLALAPGAFAQGSAEGTYAGSGGNVNRSVEGPAADPGDPGALPFSGLDILLMAGGAVVLLGTGAGISRLVAQQPTS